MKRARRSAGQSDASYSDGEEYQQRRGPAGPASVDLQKVELRRLKNREAARRVRERKSNQLNQYKSQVDDLKRENQKLLQIIAQLQNASIGCISAPLAPAATTSTLGPDAEADGPAGTASCMSAGVAPDSMDSAGPGVRSAEAPVPQSPRQLPPPAAAAAGAAGTAQRLLASTTSCPPGASGGGGAAGQDASGSCVLSQPGNVSVCGVVSSSTQQLLSGCHSAPQAFLQPTSSMQHGQVLLQRTCGCVGDEECEECEGVRVTLSSASNLPLVTTPGPRPKLLTLEDLNLAGPSRAASLHTGSLMSAPLLATTRVSGSSLSRDDPSAAAAAAGRSVDGGALRPHHSHHQPHQPLGQITEQQPQPQGGDGGTAVGVVREYVGTLEPSSRGAAGHGTRLDSHSSSGHAVFGSGGEAHPHGGGSALSESCYVRKSSSNRSTRQRANPTTAGPQKQQQQQQPPVAPQGANAAAAAAEAPAGASGSGLAVGASYLQEQQQQQHKDATAAAVAADFGAAPTPAARLADDAAAAADVVMADQGGPSAAVAAGYGPAAADNSSLPGVAAIGSNSNMVRPGSFADPHLQQGAPGSGSILIPLAAMQPPASVAAAAPPQPGAAFFGDHGYSGHKGSSTSSSKKPAQKLMRSIAAAVNGFVRPGSRRGSGPNTPRGGPADAELLRQQQQEEEVRQQQQDLASRSLPMSMLRPDAGTAAQQQFGHIGGVAANSFTAGAAAAAALQQQQQQQQALLLSSGSGVFASGYSSAGALSAQQQLLLMGQMTQGFSSGELSSGISPQQQQLPQQQPPQQTLEEEDAIILEAQLLLLQQQHQQRVVTIGGRQAQQQQQQVAAGVAPAGSKLPTGVVAMDTTPIWPAGQDSPRLPPAPAPQQHASCGPKLEQPSSAAGSSQPLPAAAVLPLNFQATYTDAVAADAVGMAGVGGGDGDSDGCLNDDAVMQLARQEGVFIDEGGSPFF